MLITLSLEKVANYMIVNLLCLHVGMYVWYHYLRSITWQTVQVRRQEKLARNFGSFQMDDNSEALCCSVLSLSGKVCIQSKYGHFDTNNGNFLSKL